MKPGNDEPESIDRGPASDGFHRAQEAPGDDDATFAPPLHDESFLRTETDRLRSLASGLLGGAHDRDDLVQDVWLEAVARPPRDSSGLSHWLRTVARHTARRLGRRSRSRADRERIAAKREALPSVLDSLEREAASAELRRAVDELASPYREVLQLHFFEECSVKTIAERLRRTENTVRSQLNRGLERLRDRYDAARVQPEERKRKRAWIWFPWLVRDDSVVSRELVRRRWKLAGGAVAAGMLGASLALFTIVRDDSDVALVSNATAATSGAAEPDTVAALELAPLDPVDGSRVTSTAATAPGAISSTAQDSATAAETPAFVVSGRAIDILGRPVANAEIWAASSTDDSDARLIAHSDSHGRYLSSELRADMWIWSEQLDNGLTERVRVRDPGTGDTASYDLVFRANLGRFAGMVRDSRGAPVDGALIRAFLIQNARPSFGSSGESLAKYAAAVRTSKPDGKFELTRLQFPRFDVLVTAQGHAPYARWFEGKCRDNLSLELPEPAALQVEIHRSDGTPAAGVALVLEHPAPLPSASATTDAQGAYRFELVPPGPFTLIAMEPLGDEPLSIVHRGELAAGQVLELEPLQLSRAFTIRGTALCDSKPIADWAVSLEDDTDAAAPRAIRVARTGADGRFAFAGCAGTSHTLRLRPTGVSQGVSHATITGIAPSTDDVVLSFDARDAPSAFVRGTVANAAIPPGHAVIVTAVRAGVDQARESADGLVDRASGRFEVGPISPGAYELSAMHSALGRWKITELSVRAGEDVDLGQISVARSATLLVRWAQDWGSGDDNFNLTIDGQGVVLSGSRDNPGARFEVDKAARAIRVRELLPGDYSMRVQGQKVATALFPVRIDEDKEASVEISLGEGAPADIRVRSPRPLLAGETLLVRIQSARGAIEFPVTERARAIDLSAVAQFRVTFPSGANRIEVITSGGLSGELLVEARGHQPLNVVTVEIR